MATIDTWNIKFRAASPEFSPPEILPQQASTLNPKRKSPYLMKDTWIKHLIDSADSSRWVDPSAVYMVWILASNLRGNDDHLLAVMETVVGCADIGAALSAIFEGLGLRRPGGMSNHVSMLIIAAIAIRQGWASDSLAATLTDVMKVVLGDQYSRVEGSSDQSESDGGDLAGKRPFARLPIPHTLDQEKVPDDAPFTSSPKSAALSMEELIEWINAHPQADLTTDRMRKAGRAVLLLRHGATCHTCSRELSEEFLQLGRKDHAGDHRIANCYLQCGPCNTRQGTRTLEEFRRWAEAHAEEVPWMKGKGKGKGLRMVELVKDVSQEAGGDADGCYLQDDDINGNGIRREVMKDVFGNPAKVLCDLQHKKAALALHLSLGGEIKSTCEGGPPRARCGVCGANTPLSSMTLTPVRDPKGKLMPLSYINSRAACRKCWDEANVGGDDHKADVTQMNTEEPKGQANEELTTMRLLQAAIQGLISKETQANEKQTRDPNKDIEETLSTPFGLKVALDDFVRDPDNMDPEIIVRPELWSWEPQGGGLDESFKLHLQSRVEKLVWAKHRPGGKEIGGSLPPNIDIWRALFNAMLSEKSLQGLKENKINNKCLDWLTSQLDATGIHQLTLEVEKSRAKWGVDILKRQLLAINLSQLSPSLALGTSSSLSAAPQSTIVTANLAQLTGKNKAQLPPRSASDSPAPRTPKPSRPRASKDRWDSLGPEARALREAQSRFDRERIRARGGGDGQGNGAGTSGVSREGSR